MGYDVPLSQFLISGLRHGFDIGYTGPNVSMECRNLKSARQNPDIVEKYLTDETTLGRIRGPFNDPPFPIFRCSPLGIVPKKASGKFRAILNLSAPFGQSVNDYISKADYSLSYITVDRAINMILDLGRGCFLSKVDIKDAFRILPVKRGQWYLLGILWKGRYYFDSRLPMGSRSSPFIFDTLAAALEWICSYKYELEHLCHLLDDFFAAEHEWEKGNALSVILNIFFQLGIPVAPEKVFGPCTCLEFLGITLDSLEFVASLSLEKIEALKGKLEVTKRELLSLIGSLSFACKVVVPGRSFLSRLISLSCSTRELEYKIYLSKQVKEDLRLWLVFSQCWNGRNFFLERDFTSSADLDFATDAASGKGY